MKIEFNKKEKRKMVAVGLRVNREDYQILKDLARSNDVSVAEAASVIFLAAFKELRSKPNKKTNQ